MRYIKFVVDTEYVGTKNEIYMETDMNDRELDETCSELAYENAEDYNYTVLGWGEDIESYAEANNCLVEDAQEELDQYYEDALDNSYWEEVTKEEYEEETR